MAEKGGKVLIHDGHRFYKNGVNGQTEYWRCAGYMRFGCLNRAFVRTIGGYDMVKIKAQHNHPPDIFSRIG